MFHPQCSYPAKLDMQTRSQGVNTGPSSNSTFNPNLSTNIVINLTEIEDVISCNGG